jgi:preprotein translocase subunit Sec63
LRFPSRTFVEAYFHTFLVLYMAYDTRFGPSAQTPDQRVRVLKQMQAAVPSLKTRTTALAQQLYARYIAGELSWLEVHQALKTTS